MTEKQALIEEILNRELAMFQAVRSITPAPCQQDPEGFRLMRSAQFSAWSPDTLASYLKDLQEAEKQDRNLMTLKYARMDNLIPVLHDNPLVESVIEQIISIHKAWHHEMTQAYPHLMGTGRPLEDTGPGATSFVTYLRGELETYSEETLALLYRDMSESMAKDENMTREVYINMVKGLGYASLEKAEAAAARQRR